MAERIHKATLSQSQGREGWSVIFRHPVLIDRITGNAGRRVRRGLGTKDDKAARRLVAELNELLADKLYWELSGRATALTRFSPLVVDIFYHDMVPDTADPFVIREIAMPLPRSTESDYRQVLLLGATGSGKSTLVRQLIGTDPESERFPSTSTARTTMADAEIFFSVGPYRAIVTFVPRDEVRDHLEESMSAAALASYHGESDLDVLGHLLHHVNPRFRFSYVLGPVDPEEIEEEGLPADPIDETPGIKVNRTRKLLLSSIKGLKQIAHDLVPGLMEEVDTTQPEEPDEIDAVMREEILEDALDYMLRGDDRFQHVADDLMQEIERRFEALPGEISKTKQGWPKSWSFELEDRQAFLKTISRFTSNDARRFGTLLTPLVTGIRVAGPFAPKWTEQHWKLVLLDGEGLGQAPDPAASLPTSITRRFEDIDAVLLVDNATQPMQAATVAAMRNLAANGQTDKLIICFTHFDNVVGDNMPTVRLRERHVLASAESVMVSIGEQLGSFAERALRQRLGSSCFFLGNLHQTLKPASNIEKRTLEHLQTLLGTIHGIVEKPPLVSSRPIYDRANLVLLVKQAAEAFHEAWKAKLGSEAQAGIMKQHWRGIKALTRRFSEAWSDEYQDLKPMADLHKELQEGIYQFIQSPVGWTGAVPSDDEKQQLFSALARDISMHLLIPIGERMQEEALQMWRDAYHLRGKNATFRRAFLLRSSVFEKIAPLLNRTPEGNKFMNDIVRVVRDAAERHGVALQFKLPGEKVRTPSSAD